jgi:hypothetical protein
MKAHTLTLRVVGTVTALLASYLPLLSILTGKTTTEGQGLSVMFFVAISVICFIISYEPTPRQ